MNSFEGILRKTSGLVTVQLNKGELLRGDVMYAEDSILCINEIRVTFGVRKSKLTYVPIGNIAYFYTEHVVVENIGEEDVNNRDPINGDHSKS